MGALGVWLSSGAKTISGMNSTFAAAVCCAVCTLPKPANSRPNPVAAINARNTIRFLILDFPRVLEPMLVFLVDPAPIGARWLVTRTLGALETKVNNQGAIGDTAARV